MSNKKYTNSITINYVINYKRVVHGKQRSSCLYLVCYTSSILLYQYHLNHDQEYCLSDHKQHYFQVQHHFVFQHLSWVALHRI